MSSLKFVVGPVACGKTVELIITANQLQSINGTDRIKILKPSIDTRFSSKVVRSASGLQIKVSNVISPIDNLLSMDFSTTDYIIVDEIQFFTVKQIEQLRQISLEKHIEIVCYGLLKDFRCKMFETSKRLLEICDEIKNMTTYCMLCKENKSSDRKIPNDASFSMKISKQEQNIKPMLDGDSICIGGIDTFIPVCYDCYSISTECLNEIE